MLLPGGAARRQQSIQELSPTSAQPCRDGSGMVAWPWSGSQAIRETQATRWRMSRPTAGGSPLKPSSGPAFRPTAFVQPPLCSDRAFSRRCRCSPTLGVPLRRRRCAGWTEPTTRGRLHTLTFRLRRRTGWTGLTTAAAAALLLRQVLRGVGRANHTAAAEQRRSSNSPAGVLLHLRRRAGWTEPTTQVQRSSGPAAPAMERMGPSEASC